MIQNGAKGTSNGPDVGAEPVDLVIDLTGYSASDSDNHSGGNGNGSDDDDDDVVVTFDSFDSFVQSLSSDSQSWISDAVASSKPCDEPSPTPSVDSFTEPLQGPRLPDHMLQELDADNTEDSDSESHDVDDNDNDNESQSERGDEPRPAGRWLPHHHMMQPSAGNESGAGDGPIDLEETPSDNQSSSSSSSRSYWACGGHGFHLCAFCTNVEPTRCRSCGFPLRTKRDVPLGGWKHEDCD